MIVPHEAGGHVDTIVDTVVHSYYMLCSLCPDAIGTLHVIGFSDQ
jgi:hypothetical protein